jgi:hypothetical protein
MAKPKEQPILGWRLSATPKDPAKGKPWLGRIVFNESAIRDLARFYNNTPGEWYKYQVEALEGTKNKKGGIDWQPKA